MTIDTTRTDPPHELDLKTLNVYVFLLYRVASRCIGLMLLVRGHVFRPPTEMHNPVAVWNVSKQAVHELAFSADGKLLAMACQDGYVRVFNYETATYVSFFSHWVYGAFIQIFVKVIVFAAELLWCIPLRCMEHRRQVHFCTSDPLGLGFGVDLCVSRLAVRMTLSRCTALARTFEWCVEAWAIPPG